MKKYRDFIDNSNSLYVLKGPYKLPQISITTVTLKGRDPRLGMVYDPRLR